MRAFGITLLAIPVGICGFAIGAPAGAQTHVCPAGPQGGERSAGMTPGGNGVAPMPLCWDDEGGNMPPPRRVPPGMDPANLPPSNIPPGHWWGSVVIASNRQLYTSNARPDRQTAEREALGKCQGAATGCTVVETVNIKDLALATDGTHTFSANAIGQQKAIDKAMKQCRWTMSGVVAVQPDYRCGAGRRVQGDIRPLVIDRQSLNGP